MASKVVRKVVRIYPDAVRRPWPGTTAAKVWIALSALGSVSTTVAMVAMERCNRAEVARLERRIEALEGSAAAGKDNASDLAHRLDGVQAQFWE